MNCEAVHQRYCIPFEVLEKYENSSITKVRVQGTVAVSSFLSSRRKALKEKKDVTFATDH